MTRPNKQSGTSLPAMVIGLALMSGVMVTAMMLFASHTRVDNALEARAKVKSEMDELFSRIEKNFRNRRISPEDREGGFGNHVSFNVVAGSLEVRKTRFISGGEVPAKVIYRTICQAVPAGHALESLETPYSRDAGLPDVGCHISCAASSLGIQRYAVEEVTYPDIAHPADFTSRVYPVGLDILSPEQQPIRRLALDMFLCATDNGNVSDPVRITLSSQFVDHVGNILRKTRSVLLPKDEAPNSALDVNFIDNP
jgi:hypothetical protein